MVVVYTSCTTAIIEEDSPSSLPPIDRIVTYDADVKVIMTNNCITCHSGPAPSANLDLSTYLNVRYSSEQGTLVERLNNATNPMPPNGILPAETRQLIDKWVTDGFPEN